MHEYLTQYPPIWKNNVVDDAYETAIHYHIGTSTDGCDYNEPGWSLFVGSTGTHDRMLGFPFEEHTINLEYNPSWIGTSTFGIKGSLLRKPKLIRIVFGAGWNSQEIYPLTVRDVSEESTYLPHVSAGNLENAIDYSTDIIGPLRSFANVKKIPIVFMRQDTSEIIAPYEFTGNDRTIDLLSVVNLSGIHESIYYPRGHPSRWLVNMAARYAYPSISANVEVLEGPYFPRGKQLTTSIPIRDIIGGEVLNIIFVSDAYASYHGVNSSTFVDTSSGLGDFVDKSTVFNRACYQEDIQRVIDQYPRFQKWGLIIVNALKNPVGFPLWCRGNPNNSTNQTRAYCFYNAQIHFREVESALREAGIPVKLLMRDVAIVPPVKSFELKSLDFTKPAVTVNDIMNSVYQFWDSGTL